MPTLLPLGRPASVAIVLTVTAAARAAYTPVYGGPAFDAATGTGVNIADEHTRQGAPSPAVSTAGSGIVGNGSAVDFGAKYENGASVGIRAFRFDAGGAVELGNLGPNLSGGVESRAYAVNPAGVAVGFARKLVGPSYDTQAVRWDANGTPTELGNIGFISGHASSQAWAVNDRGTAVGFALKYANGTTYGARAVRWDANTIAASELGTLGTDAAGKGGAYAYAVNAGGAAVGMSDKYDADGRSLGYRAVRWDANATAATDLGGLVNGSLTGSSVAHDINAGGTVVGNSTEYLSPGNVFNGSTAVRWAAGSTAPTKLGTIGTDSRGRAYSRAFAVNDAGTAVGLAEKYTDGAFEGERAVRWDADGTAATELGLLPDSGTFSASQAFAVNADGLAVGTTYLGGNGSTARRQRAVAWGLDGRAIDLTSLLDPALGWTLLEARAVSDTGWVSGRGTFDPDGAGPLAAYGRAFLMQVPEPASLGLLGVAALGLCRRRLRRA